MTSTEQLNTSMINKEEPIKEFYIEPIKKKKIINAINQKTIRNKPSWIRYINSRIKNNKNFLNITSGPTGSGKSWSILSICEMLNDDFTAERVVFRARDLMKLVNDPKYEGRKGIVILWDEAGIELNNKNWQSKINRVINFLIQTFRHRNFILFFTSPHADFIDASTRKMFHSHFETLEIDKVNKLVRIKPFQTQYNAELKKYYRKFLINNDGKITRWDIPKPSQKLIDAYEKKKTEFTATLNKNILNDLDESEPEENNIITTSTPTEPIIESKEIVNGILLYHGHKIRDPKYLDIIRQWKKGIVHNKDIAKNLGIDRVYVNNNVGHMRRRYDILPCDFEPTKPNTDNTIISENEKNFENANPQISQIATQTT